MLPLSFLRKRLKPLTLGRTVDCPVPLDRSPTHLCLTYDSPVAGSTVDLHHQNEQVPLVFLSHPSPPPATTSANPPLAASPTHRPSRIPLFAGSCMVNVQ